MHTNYHRMSEQRRGPGLEGNFTFPHGPVLSSYYYYKSQMLQTNLLSTAANLKGEEEKVEGKGEEEA